MSDLTVPVSDTDHAQGPDNAPVTLVEYGDYQCPDCGTAFAIVRALQNEMGDNLRFVFRNFPLTDIHAHAENAAEAAECAAAQDKFWPMHDLLFTHQTTLTARDLERYAAQAGVDAGKFAADLNHHTYAPRVASDLQSGEASGVQATPTFFINGVRYDDSYDAQTLLAALQAAMD